MALSKLDNLYRQVILEHGQHPRHYGELNNKTNEIEMFNPTCGDEITLQVKIVDQKIQDIKFQGQGCTISKASASMMAEELVGKDIKTCQVAAQAFSKLVMGEEITDSEDELLGDAVVLAGVQQFPARIKCATLAWKGLAQVLAKVGEKNE